MDTERMDMEKVDTILILRTIPMKRVVTRKAGSPRTATPKERRREDITKVATQGNSVTFAPNFIRKGMRKVPNKRQSHRIIREIANSRNLEEKVHRTTAATGR